MAGVKNSSTEKKEKKIKMNQWNSGVSSFSGRKKENMALWKSKYKATKTKCEKSENFKRLITNDQYGKHFI